MTTSPLAGHDAGSHAPRTILQHRAAVEALLRAVTEARGVEALPVDAAALAGHAEHYRNRRLARTVMCPIDLPPFDNSQMDGYAVGFAKPISSTDDPGRAETSGSDLPGRAGSAASFQVGRPIAAGDPVGDLTPGEARAIMTGAPIPRGAAAVVPIEIANPPRFEPSPSAVTLPRDALVSGRYVRARGSDISAGAELLPAGVLLGPAQWGVLAHAGVETVEVEARLRVLVISTGSELRTSGQDLAPGQIYDANGTILAAALSAAGAVVVAVSYVPDDPGALADAIAAHVGEIDLVITSGGVSAGAYEVVKDLAASQRDAHTAGPRGRDDGSRVDFISVAMQPGGPQGIGSLEVARADAASGEPAESVPVLCFPGNPVSTLVSFEMFLRPLLAPPRAPMLCRLGEALTSPPDKHQVRRGVLGDDGRVRLSGGPGSHLLHGYARSGLLVHVPAGVAALAAGDEVEVWSIDG